jgi:ribonuclease BN (tRNA processing enzyme)
MDSVQVTFLGCGDAFGSGGRLQTCILVRVGAAAVLVDCGTTALIGLRRQGVDPNTVDAILITHLHGDHFGGVPFFVLDAQLISRRTRPLLVVGPAGTRARLREVMEALFPGMSAAQQKFALEVTELEPGRRTPLVDLPGGAGLAGLVVTPQAVRHTPGTAPTALRIECGGRTLCYSGDTEWCDGLAAAAQGADLLIAEAYFHDKRIPFHLDLATLRRHLPALNVRRTVLTHMSADMLAHAPELELECAEDGMVLEV